MPGFFASLVHAVKALLKRNRKRARSQSKAQSSSRKTEYQKSIRTNSVRSRNQKHPGHRPAKQAKRKTSIVKQGRPGRRSFTTAAHPATSREEAARDETRAAVSRSAQDARSGVKPGGRGNSWGEQQQPIFNPSFSFSVASSSRRTSSAAGSEASSTRRPGSQSSSVRKVGFQPRAYQRGRLQSASAPVESGGESGDATGQTPRKRSSWDQGQRVRQRQRRRQRQPVAVRRSKTKHKRDSSFSSLGSWLWSAPRKRDRREIKRLGSILSISPRSRRKRDHRHRQGSRSLRGIRSNKQGKGCG